jgi:hypothetical protein
MPLGLPGSLLTVAGDGADTRQRRLATDDVRFAAIVCIVCTVCTGDVGGGFRPSAAMSARP